MQILGCGTRGSNNVSYLMIAFIVPFSSSLWFVNSSSLTLVILHMTLHPSCFYKRATLLTSSTFAFHCSNAINGNRNVKIIAIYMNNENHELVLDIICHEVGYTWNTYIPKQVQWRSAFMSPPLHLPLF